MTSVTPKKKGRPRKKPLPPVPSPPRTIVVYRKVPGSEEVRRTAVHQNVPGDWPAKVILDRYGIGQHLKVVSESEGRHSVLQDFPVINS